MALAKVPTGIPGFDALIAGGIPAGSSVLVCGTPGTAKTTFCMQFIQTGCEKKERCLYVSLEQSEEEVLRQAQQFGWDFARHQREGSLTIYSVAMRNINAQTVPRILEIIRTQKIRRFVIDSISALSITAPIYAAISELYLRDFITEDKVYPIGVTENYLLKRFVYDFIGELRQLSVTSLLISEVGDESKSYSTDKVSEFLCDGIIQLSFESMGGKYSRSLLVRKMRYVKNNEEIHPVEISKKGLVVHNL